MNFIPSTSLLRRTWRLALLVGVLATIAFLAIGNSSLLARLLADQALALVSQRSEERSETDDDDDTDGETTKLELTPGLIRHSLRKSRAERSATLLPRFTWLRPDRISPCRMAESASSLAPTPFPDGYSLPLRC